MKLSLGLAAAAAAFVACVGSPAMAAGSTSVSINGECDTLNISTSGTWVAARESNNTGGCQSVIGEGFRAKIKGNEYLVVGAIFDRDATREWTFTLSYPLVTGGTWALYHTHDGATMRLDGTGTYTVNGGGATAASGTQAWGAHTQ
jgi:hypothetical protein